MEFEKHGVLLSSREEKNILDSLTPFQGQETMYIWIYGSGLTLTHPEKVRISGVMRGKNEILSF